MCRRLHASEVGIIRWHDAGHVGAAIRDPIQSDFVGKRSSQRGAGEARYDDGASVAVPTASFSAMSASDVLSRKFR